MATKAIRTNPNDLKVVIDKPSVAKVQRYPGDLKLGGQVERFYPVTVNPGQPMGLLLALLYKDGFTVQSQKSP